jgi:hypothetical protein
MMKTKWFDLTTQGTLETLAEVLPAQPFRRGAASGIEMLSVTHRHLEGKFIEEFVEVEISVDPFGDEIRNKVHRFAIFSFVIYRVVKGSFLLRVASPPRNLRSFVQFLADTVGFGLAVSPITVEVRGFVDVVKAIPDVHLVRTRKIRVGHVKLVGQSLARVEVVSASDAFADLAETMNVDGAILEKATVEFHFDGVPQSMEITANGVLTLDESLLPTMSSVCFEFFKKTDSYANVRT